jgi:Cdc6-like AAA superfamily ATPase
MSSSVKNLRRLIQENIRIQRGTDAAIEYIDVTNALDDAITKQNHVIFGRRGCGKSLLLHNAQAQLKDDARVIYINCEDYKQHSFPNVLIAILDALFQEMERHLSGWFGKKRRLKEIIKQIRHELAQLEERPSVENRSVKQKQETVRKRDAKASLGAEQVAKLQVSGGFSKETKDVVESEYQTYDNKMNRLNELLPKLKQHIREFFELSSKVKVVFIELDDFYQLQRTMQPHVADYVHRLCKDVPLFFKIATLRHISTLYADRNKQPTGIQQRHDYQPIDIDYTLASFTKTSDQLRQILQAYATKAGLSSSDARALFKGGGFNRLVLASGGVPRDFLSLLLQALSGKSTGEEQVGKDDVRLLSLQVFQTRIEERKADSEEVDHDVLMRATYAIRKFCLDRKSNVFLVPDQLMQERDDVKDLLYRLLDYRIIHAVGTALTHKSQSGHTYAAFMIDIGAYAKFRNLVNRLNEIDVTANDAREKCRNAPILDEKVFDVFMEASPAESEHLLLAELAEQDED